jgi:sn-glycerol 3-phosphate transport system ATP-binding protein
MPPPAEIYAHPATSFAASFLGTPPMNLFPLDRAANGLVVRGTALPVVSPTVGGELIGGIRPESLRLAERGIPARVELAEYLGADTILTCIAGEARLLARLPGRVELARRAAVHLTTDLPIHLFDAVTGVARFVEQRDQPLVQMMHESGN